MYYGKYSCWSQAFNSAYMLMALLLLMNIYDRLFYNVYLLDQISEYPSEVREELSILRGLAMLLI